MTKQARLVFGGGLRFDATTSTGHRISLDAPEGEVGGDAGAGPREALLVALGACGGMDVASILRKKRQVVTSHEITVVGEEREAHPHTFTEITVTHEIEGPELDAEAVRRAIELSATRYCPVNAMLSAGDTAIHHRYVVRAGERETAGEVVTTGPHGAGLAPAQP
jgi:putative redox protein